MHKSNIMNKCQYHSCPILRLDKGHEMKLLEKLVRLQEGSEPLRQKLNYS